MATAKVGEGGVSRTSRVRSVVVAAALVGGAVTGACIMFPGVRTSDRGATRHASPTPPAPAGSVVRTVAASDRAALDHAARALCRHEDPRDAGLWEQVERFREIASSVERGEYGVVWPTFGNDVADASAKLGRLNVIAFALEDSKVRSAYYDLSSAAVLLALAIGEGDFSKALTTHDAFCNDALRLEAMIRDVQHR